MISKTKIFISSVQKELELERAAVAGLVSSDPFLVQHCVPVLFEKEPPPPRPTGRPFLDALRQCQVYVLLIAKEYGGQAGEQSAMHLEYLLAQELRLPTIVFLKGEKDDERSPEARVLIAEIKKAGHTYKRFHDREDLKPELFKALTRTLAEEFGISASDIEVSESAHQIESASGFEAAILEDVSVRTLDPDLVDAYRARISTGDVNEWLSSSSELLHAHGLAVRDTPGVFHATAGAFILFSPFPAHRFPQCEILVDAYDDSRITGRPKGQMNINAPLLRALEQILKFVDDHTFHPRRVVGLNNVRLDEYPVAALREALLNAVAHRSYEDASRKVFVRLFLDRIEIASPGYPLKPLTLAKLRRGQYRPCSRNPLIAQTLAMLDKMEQRGSGFARMRDAMLDHGLDAPVLDQQDGYFVVTLPGPAGAYDRIRPPASSAGPVTPSVEAQLNDRQKRILREVMESGMVTRRWCAREFEIANDTAGRDLKAMTDMGLLIAEGKGRAVRYVMGGSTGGTDKK